jgi:hypothetical protein
MVRLAPFVGTVSKMRAHAASISAAMINRLLAIFLLTAAAAHAADTRLGPAPRVDPEGPLPPQSLAPLPKAVASVPAIDTFDRAAVVAAYNTYYNVTMPAVGFTGSTAGCNPGAISLAFQEWTVTRINFLRAMAGVPGNTTLDTSLNAQEQAAALIMAANSTLTHDPDPGMLCYSAQGDTGAGSSNLAYGTGLTDALPLYMSDPGTGNEAAGHRRWILHSRKARFGLGNANGSPYNANALYTFDFGGSSSGTSGIPWPPRGYVPTALFPSPFPGEGQRWSFGLPNANFGAANVTMTVNGVALPVTVISRTANGYGDNTIVWSLPVGHVVVPDAVYVVTITGVAGAASSAYAYRVIPTNPAAAAPPNPARLSNISTRLPVLTGSDVMIAGFVIGGSTNKDVAVVVTGPSLSAFGIANPLANPTLTLVRSSDQAVIATNDDWQAAPNFGALLASGFAPANSLEPGLFVNLAPGAYTAIVQGATGGTGTAVAAVYEAAAPTTPLVNISTRGRVQAGNDVMIGGFVITGSAPQQVAIVATGPSLSAFGIANPLANPALTLVRSSDQAVLATNDDWQSAGNAAQLQAAGFAPSNPVEAAILTTLPPGAYTAIVQGSGGGTGVAVVGVYRVN